MCFVFQRLLCRQLMQHHRRSLTVSSHLSCYQYQYDQFHDHDNNHHDHDDHYHDHDHDDHQKGKFQCGPASVAAIKMGMIGLAHDVGFVFSEVRIVIIIMVIIIMVIIIMAIMVIIIVVIMIIMVSLIISIITNMEWLLSFTPLSKVDTKVP